VVARDPQRRAWRKGQRSWTRFERAWMTDNATPDHLEHQRVGNVEWWRNNLYQVGVNHAPCLPHPASSWPPMFWLSVRRIERCALPRDWRDLQRIKNEIAGPTREAVELFPNEIRLTDESDQFHLWVLAPDGLRFPFGYGDRNVSGPDTSDGRTDVGGSQRPFEFEEFFEPVSRCATCARLPESCSCGGAA
jgi:hypothetical protein